ncbi:UvrABC system protein B [Bacillus paralicheniformis]|uniref:DEAD/DEAH box helicase n=1 Tax=Bacillus paralicheniformis TaxID=1648923 RepID=UPI0011A70561|nr:DEAD/DEAH box helicase family protein [Bacillus paralicheniformis]TWJ33959.1 UvrABC system protein B [Bacillus paralicheniformis]
MAFDYRENYFSVANPNIHGNSKLREPQIQGYSHVYDHFKIKKKKSHAVIVLPTGVGKTGLMALLPYNISNGRVLIIAPQIVIKDTVIDQLNPDIPTNFWLSRNVFDRPGDLPTLIEFEGKKTNTEVLRAANIVVVNIQKLQSRLDSSPLNFLPKDFFDMIIIDEAHHSVAKTWVETTQHFSGAKVVKVTGTPIRTDKEKITGEMVYKYKLSQAMANGYVKSLENFTYIPEKLILTLDNDSTKNYTIDEIYELNLKDEEWVSRKVALSPDCARSVVAKSIELLEKKRRGTDVPHKIIAVATDISHAMEIKALYDEFNYPSTIVHSELDAQIKEQALLDIKNHRVKVVINVSMLGEGYDHPYLSVAAIFRAFRNPLPYAQFIGRILRVIPSEEVNKAEDNIGQIVAHKHLALDDLWKYYKKEIQESDIIKYINGLEVLESDGDDIPQEGRNSHNSRKRTISEGTISESGSGKLTGDVYLTTKLIEQKRKEDKIREEKILEIQRVLNLEKEQAERIVDQATGDTDPIKRPDLYFESKRRDIDVTIKEQIVPQLLLQFNLDIKGSEVKNTPLFNSGKYRWIPRNVRDNGGMIATYLSHYLNNEIGRKKADWTIDDYDLANAKLLQITEYVEKVFEDWFGDR